jgi:hypothetical protein
MTPRRAKKTAVAAARLLKSIFADNKKGSCTGTVILLPVTCQGKVTVTLRYDNDTVEVRSA